MIGPRDVILENAPSVFEEPYNRFAFPPANLWAMIRVLHGNFDVTNFGVRIADASKKRLKTFDEESVGLFGFMVFGFTENGDIYYIFDFEFEIGIAFLRKDVDISFEKCLVRIADSERFGSAIDENISTSRVASCTEYLREWQNLFG